MDKAIAWFQQALMLDPNYAPAYVGLARCYYGVSNRYYPPAEMMPKVKSAALKAIELDPALGEAHATLALVRTLYDFNRSEAEKGFRRALELKPSDADAHAWYGRHLLRMGRFDEALAEAERAQMLDPVSPDLNTSVPWALYFAHRYDQVIQRVQPIIERHPNYKRLHVLSAMAYEQKGEWAKAIAEIEKAVDPNGAEVDDLARLGHVYAVSGRTADARKILVRMMKESHRRYVASFGIALLHAGLGQRDEAFRWLQKAYEDRSENLAYINVDPAFDAFHSDPRWAGILRSVGLTQ